MSRKKESLKVHFDITLKYVENLPLKDGNVYITWKRGAKGENNGESRHVVVLDKKAVFEEVVPLSCTIYKDKKGYEAKNLALTLKEEKGKKGNSLAKTVIDISEFVGAKDEKRTFSLKSKKSKTPITLVASFRTKETEMHPDDPVTETDGGVTDHSLSDDDDEASEDFQDDDSHKSSSKDRTPKKPEISQKRESLASPLSATLTSTPPSSSSSSSSAAEIEELRSQLEKAKKRSKELATENVDQEEQIEELKKEIEELKKSGGGGSGAASPGREAELKKRVKELATENVDLEEQVNDLKTQVDDLKAQLEQQQKKAETKSPNGTRNSAVVDELNKKVAELQAANSEKDNQIASQKQEIEKLKQNVKDNEKAASDKVELRSRIKELAGENVDLEDQINDLKRELENLKKGSSNGRSSGSSSGSSSAEADLKVKIKDLTDSNREKDRKIDEQEAEIERLTRQSKDRNVKNSNDNQTQIDDLTRDNKEKAATIAANKQELEKLRKDLQDAQKREKTGGAANVAASEDLRRKLEDSNKEKEDKDAEIDKLRDKVERLKLKKDDADSKVEEIRGRENDLQQRVQELEEANERLEAEAALSKSASGLTKDKDRERDRERDRRDKEKVERERLEKERLALEKDMEKEKERGKKLEKEIKELKDKLRDMESNGVGKSPAAQQQRQQQQSSKPSASDEEDKAIAAALYETPAAYRDDDGLPLCTVELWDVLTNHDAFNNNYELAAKVTDALEKSVMRMPHDMNALFYWLSTTTSLLHLLRDHSEGDADNDRDPIIDGVYKVDGTPGPNASLQERLEWVAFQAYKFLVRAICKKLEPVIIHAIIEEPVDKKTGVQPKLVTRILDRVLHRSRDHFLYDAVVQQIYCQVFYYINAHLLNSLLKKDRLTAGIGFQIKLGISRLDDWLASASSESDERSLLSPASDFCDTLREVANALVVDKALFADGAATQSIFRALSLRQLKRILEVYVPDNLSPHPLPPAARDAVAATWYASRPEALPFILDEEKNIDFQPRL